MEVMSMDIVDGSTDHEHTSTVFCFPESGKHQELKSLVTTVEPSILRSTDDSEPLGSERRARRLLSISTRGCGSTFDPNLTSRSLGGNMEGMNASRRSSLRIRGSPSDGLDRAVSMVQTYPLMVVDGTAFENQINRRPTSEGTDLTQTLRSNTSLSLAEGDEVGENSTSLMGALGRVRQSSSVVSLAVKVKRACMWETIIVNFLAQRAWNQEFRLHRLRKVLETHMLPVILRKREGEGFSWKFMRRTHIREAAMLRDDEDMKVQGNFLMEKSPFFASFGSLKLCDAIAEIVIRYRYSAGAAIVTAGTPMHNALYILISGKCDAIRCTGEKNIIDRTRVEPGSFFGGLLGSKAVFSETYRSISQCIVWVIKREAFEKIFREYADVNMKRTFLDHLKKHEMERLQESFPLPDCMPRVPIYRHIDQPTTQIEQYARDFKPLVLTQGDVLFKEGDPPGAVYCLVEGYVQRVQGGFAAAGANGRRQILSPNDADNSFSLSTRFLLLGEEPHILPASLRYTCTVLSRSALFFKIKGERFVNALMDDAKLFLQLREKLTSQIRSSMRISPEALQQVPVLRDLPRSQISAIVNVAQPRVLERCLSICEPAQNIMEIYIVSAGAVRDPRQFSHMPTYPVAASTTEAEKSQEEVNVKGRKEKSHKMGLSTRDREPKTLAVFSQLDGSPKMRGVVQPLLPSEAASVSMAPETSGEFGSIWSLGGDLSGTSRTVMYPDEECDLSPPLPPNPLKEIVCTIGGGWEGLLLDKWPNGWETTTTVELWAVPVLNIRTAFNSMPKAVQASILSYLRNIQMMELGLAAPVVAKLPPMSLYQPLERRLTKPSLHLEKSSGRAHRRKRAGSGTSPDFSNVAGGKRKNSNDLLSVSYSSMLSVSKLSLSFFPGNCSTREEKKTTKPQPSRPHPPSPSPARRNGKKEDKRASLKRLDAVGSSPDVQVPKAGPPPLLFLRRLATKPVEETPLITPELCAAYAGTEPQKNIIRGPPSIPTLRSKVHMDAVMQTGSHPTWPTPSNVKKHWFHVLPSVAPLPGTVNNQNYAAVVPSLVPNTALMVKREKGYGDVLGMQAAYFASQMQKKRRAAESSTGLADGNSKAFSLVKRRGLSPRGEGHPTPGRHACRL